MLKFHLRFCKEEKVSWLIFIVSFIVYAVLSMTKSVYSASIASIIDEGIFSKSQAGIINSGFYLFYGLGQIVGIRLVEKISPTKYLLFALIGTVVCITGMAFSDSFYAMLIFWCVCGLIQFGVWPAELRIISECVLPELQAKSMTYISFSYCVGMLFNYLLAAIVLRSARWPMLFLASALILIICIIALAYTIILTKKTADDIKKINKEFNERKLKELATSKETALNMPNFGKIIFSSGIVLLLVPAFIRASLDIGLKSWVPTMIVESYSVSTSFASMLTTVLVFVNLGGVFIANAIYPRMTKNATLGYTICFLISLPFTAMLLFTGKVHVLIVALLLTVTTTMMYAGHQLQNVIIPSYFARYNKAGSVAAIINALASFGIVVSSVAYGFIAENYGWSATIMSWIILSLIATAFCATASFVWAKFIKIK